VIKLREGHDATVWVGDNRDIMPRLKDKEYQACITSVPYHGLKMYGAHAHEIGREATLAKWQQHLRQVFQGVERLVVDNGVVFAVIGDRIAGARSAEGPRRWSKDARPARAKDNSPTGSLVGLDYRLRAALEAEGWMYRSEIIWEKSGQTSRSETRPQVTHEKILMFVKNMNYRYYQKAVQELATDGTGRTKDLGSVWPIAQETQVRDGIAAFPLTLATIMVLLSTKPGDHVLDCFSGTGTTGVAAKMAGRRYTGIELYPDIAAKSIVRIQKTAVVEMPTPHIVDFNKRNRGQR
jgi:site-specific DNA-methyltransferase (cytosine-N4-specific)